MRITDSLKSREQAPTIAAAGALPHQGKDSSYRLSTISLSMKSAFKREIAKGLKPSSALVPP